VRLRVVEAGQKKSQVRQIIQINHPDGGLSSPRLGKTTTNLYLQMAEAITQ
jgi:hypothetical protein